MTEATHTEAVKPKDVEEWTKAPFGLKMVGETECAFKSIISPVEEMSGTIAATSTDDAKVKLEAIYPGITFEP
jgi:hypothetical protein